jgi:hypothetical protein
LWTEGGTLLTQVTNPYVPQYSWRWFNVAPVTLTAGNNYIVSGGIRGYYFMGEDNPGMTADGVIDPTDWMYYLNSPYGFPGSSAGSSPLPLVDIHYSYSYLLPDVLTDTADVFVDNIAPIPINPTAIGEPGLEGSNLGFTAEFYDIGVDDDWWYRWDWGDGTMSNWRKVNKYSGGARVLLYHSIAGYENEVYDSLAAEMGSYATIFDIWSFYDDPGTLEELSQYDVLIMPENTGIIGGWPDDVGDVIADYVDAGGGMVDMVATFYNAGTWGITGRWADEDYSCFNGGYIGGSSSTTAIYDPTHPIIDGFAGTVSSWGTSIPVSVPSVRSDATLLADYPSYPAAAYKDAGTMGPGSGRIASLNIFILDGYRSGDALMVTANAAIWASGKAPPVPLSMPIPLEQMDHIYVDDHPDHITHQDTFYPTVQVRDDDHLKEVVVGAPVPVYFTDFETGPSWPAGWYEGGDYAWYMRSNPTEMYGSWCARRNYYPYGISHLYSPTFDFTGLGGAVVDFDHWWWTGWGGAYQDGLVQISIDGGSTWNTIAEYHHNDPTEVIEHVQVMFGAAADQPSVQLRFWIDMYNDWYWEVDNVGLQAADTYTMYGMGEASTTALVENVFPSIIFPPNLVTLTDENVPISFEGIEITDPALFEKTESYWYKYIWDDGQETAWINKGSTSCAFFADIW